MTHVPGVTHHQEGRLTLIPEGVDDEHTIVTIGSFDNESKAADYIASMFISDYVFGGIDKSKYTITPISIKNYPIFYQSKDLEEYNTFIETNNKN